MSPELKIRVGGFLNFDPEKSDIFSLGITFLRSILLLDKSDLHGLND